MLRVTLSVILQLVGCVCLVFRSMFWGFVFGGTDFICTKVKGKSTLCATLSVILRQMYVLLFNVFFWRSVHNVAAPPISSITATALRASCHIIGHLAADVSSHLAGKAT